ncbi:MAG: hypothetical protein U5L96_10320 [Owenweeksia sp.]|nr:hypothetical protein [Owenweeksia sp.]
MQNQKVEFSLSRDNFSPFASISVAKLYEDVTSPASIQPISVVVRLSSSLLPGR